MFANTGWIAPPRTSCDVTRNECNNFHILTIIQLRPHLYNMFGARAFNTYSYTKAETKYAPFCKFLKISKLFSSMDNVFHWNGTGICSHVLDYYGPALIQMMPSLMPRLIGPTWSPCGANRIQVAPMLGPWNLLSGLALKKKGKRPHLNHWWHIYSAWII